MTSAATYYYTGLGACGWNSKDTDLIAAVGHGLFDGYPLVKVPLRVPLFPSHRLVPSGYNGANPNNNPVCGKKIKAKCKCLFMPDAKTEPSDHDS